MEASNTVPAYSLRKKATIHQVTTILATSKKSYFQVITTCLQLVLMTLHFNYHPCLHAGDKVLGHQYRWLAGGYDVEVGHF